MQIFGSIGGVKLFLNEMGFSVVRWLVSYEDENEYDNDNGNEIED